MSQAVMLQPSPDAAVRTILARGEGRRTNGAVPEFDDRFVSLATSPAALRAWLHDKASGRFDAPTIIRALGPDLSVLAARAARTAEVHDVQVISSPEQRPEAAVVCIDVAAMGGVGATLRWITATSANQRGDRLVIAAIGVDGYDLSSLSGFVDGVVTRPRLQTPRAWAQSVAPLVQASKDPGHEDALPARETQGAVSEEEFEETIAQAALPDSDPQKRD
jgi:hypothetical protein